MNGVTYQTTQQTLCSVKGSRFPDLLGTADDTAGGKKLCIDRNGQVRNAGNAELRPRPSERGAQCPLIHRTESKLSVLQAFAYILEYLRACRHSRNKFRLPSAECLRAVIDEANFFWLPGTLLCIQYSAVLDILHFHATII